MNKYTTLVFKSDTKESLQFIRSYRKTITVELGQWIMKF